MFSLWAMALLWVGACGKEPGDMEEVPVVDGPVQAVEETPRVDPVGEMRRLDEPTAPSSRTYRLLLVNPSGATVEVRAEAGADTVFVESVEAGDSARVDLVVRSDVVRLLSLQASRSTPLPTLRFPADSTRRLELGGP